MHGASLPLAEPEFSAFSRAWPPPKVVAMPGPQRRAWVGSYGKAAGARDLLLHELRAETNPLAQLAWAERLFAVNPQDPEVAATITTWVERPDALNHPWLARRWLSMDPTIASHDEALGIEEAIAFARRVETSPDANATGGEPWPVTLLRNTCRDQGLVNTIGTGGDLEHNLAAIAEWLVATVDDETIDALADQLAAHRPATESTVPPEPWQSFSGWRHRRQLATLAGAEQMCLDGADAALCRDVLQQRLERADSQAGAWLEKKLRQLLADNRIGDDLDEHWWVFGLLARHQPDRLLTVAKEALNTPVSAAWARELGQLTPDEPWRTDLDALLWQRVHRGVSQAP